MQSIVAGGAGCGGLDVELEASGFCLPDRSALDSFYTARGPKDTSDTSSTIASQASSAGASSSTAGSSRDLNRVSLAKEADDSGVGVRPQGSSNECSTGASLADACGSSEQNMQSWGMGTCGISRNGAPMGQLAASDTAAGCMLDPAEPGDSRPLAHRRQPTDSWGSIPTAEGSDIGGIRSGHGDEASRSTSPSTPLPTAALESASILAIEQLEAGDRKPHHAIEEVAGGSSSEQDPYLVLKESRGSGAPIPHASDRRNIQARITAQVRAAAQRSAHSGASRGALKASTRKTRRQGQVACGL